MIDKIESFYLNPPTQFNKSINWGTWANSDSKKKKIFRSQCSYALQQIDDKSWATFLKNNGLDISVFRKRLLVSRIKAIDKILKSQV